MAVSCTLLLVLVVEIWCSPVLRGVLCTFKDKIVTVWLFRNPQHFWNAYSWKTVFFTFCQFDFFCLDMYWETRWFVAYRNVRMFLFLYCIQDYSCAKIDGESLIWNENKNQLLVLVCRRIRSMTATYYVKNRCACQIKGFVQVFAVDGRKPHGTCIVLGGWLLDYCNTW
jgi:hypothetical protein